jgi:hypothetical protein
MQIELDDQLGGSCSGKASKIESLNRAHSSVEIVLNGRHVYILFLFLPVFAYLTSIGKS